MMWLNTPFVRSINSIIMEQMAMAEMKCGIYVIICTHFLNFSERSSLSMNASRMGMGNPATSEYTLMPSVLRSRGQKLEDVTKRIKCSMPTQLLPMMPLRKEKSLNAIWMPYMGT